MIRARLAARCAFSRTGGSKRLQRQLWRNRRRMRRSHRQAAAAPASRPAPPVVPLPALAVLLPAALVADRWRAAFDSAVPPLQWRPPRGAAGYQRHRLASLAAAAAAWARMLLNRRKPVRHVAPLTRRRRCALDFILGARFQTLGAPPRRGCAARSFSRATRGRGLAEHARYEHVGARLSRVSWPAAAGCSLAARHHRAAARECDA